MIHPIEHRLHFASTVLAVDSPELQTRVHACRGRTWEVVGARFLVTGTLVEVRILGSYSRTLESRIKTRISEALRDPDFESGYQKLARKIGITD
jgi:hypothetical protein